MTGSSSRPGLGTVRRVYAVWGRHPRLYAAQDWITFLGRHHAIRRRAVEATGMGPGARVLEVACGTGRNFRYIEDRIGLGGRLVGFDYSDEMLSAAGDLSRRHGWSNVELVQGDAAVLDIGDEPFDAVVSVLGISAVPDYTAALERCRAVLRPGGVLSVCDAQLFSGAMRVLNPIVRAAYTRGAAWNPDRDIPEDMQRIFGNVSVETFNLGTFFVATSTREPVP
jgi:demethylmenaquinone methyltransferase/2-methoxy-6-polyprenyl-1,4-benzoquinol methylase